MHRLAVDDGGHPSADHRFARARFSAAILGLSELRQALAYVRRPSHFSFFRRLRIASALSAQGIDRWLAGSLAHLGKGRFIPVAFLLFLGTALLSMWMSNTATAAMMIPLALGILRQFREQATSRTTRSFSLLGLAYSASIGGLGTIVGSPPNGIAAKQLGVTFSEWMGFGIPAVAILSAGHGGHPLPCLRPRIRTEPMPDLTMNPATSASIFRVKVTLGIFALTALAWIFSARLAQWFSVGDMDTWIALAATVLLSLARVVTWKEIEAGTDWGVLLLFGGGLALQLHPRLFRCEPFHGKIAGRRDGRLASLGYRRRGRLLRHFPDRALQQHRQRRPARPDFLHHGHRVRLAPEKLIFPLALAASCAFMLPVGTPPNAIVFGTGLVPQREMIRAGVVLNVLFILLITALAMVLF